MGGESVYLVRDWDKEHNNIMLRNETSILLNKNQEFLAFGLEARIVYRRWSIWEEERSEDRLFFPNFVLSAHGIVFCDFLVARTSRSAT